MEVRDQSPGDLVRAVVAPPAAVKLFPFPAVSAAALRLVFLGAMGKKRIEAKLERRAMAGDVRGGRRGKWQGKKNPEEKDGIFTVLHKRITTVQSKI
jgi:hypothetical protein